jgi:hypothetical protein
MAVSQSGKNSDANSQHAGYGFDKPLFVIGDKAADLTCG